MSVYKGHPMSVSDFFFEEMDDGCMYWRMFGGKGEGRTQMCRFSLTPALISFIQDFHGTGSQTDPLSRGLLVILFYFILMFFFL